MYGLEKMGTQLTVTLKHREQGADKNIDIPMDFVIGEFTRGRSVEDLIRRYLRETKIMSEVFKEWNLVGFTYKFT